MRRHDTVRLTRRGFFGERYSEQANKRMRDGVSKCRSFFEMNADTPFEIEGKVTLKDFVRILLELLACGRINEVERLANSNIVPYLDDYLLDPKPRADNDGQPLKAIEVYHGIELSNHESGDDTYDLTMYTSAHGIGEIHKEVAEALAEGKMDLETASRCNTYAIEFTPWQQMLHLPIQVRREAFYSKSVWKKCPPKEMKIGVLGSKRKFSFGKTERELVTFKEEPQMKVRAQMTLRGFLSGFFNELAFFGTPNRRNEKMDELTSTMKDVEKKLKKKI